MRTRVVTINGNELDQHDRRVLQTWCGQEIGTHGDVCIEITKAQARHLDQLFEMLGK